MFKFFIAMGLLASSLGGFAQVTESIDLSDRAHVPLFDCSIFTDRDDRKDCKELSDRLDNRWDNGGYAVNCHSFGRRKESICLGLASSIIFSPVAFSCGRGPWDRLSDEGFKQCELTRRAYENGSFRGSAIRTTTTTTTTTSTVRNNGPMACDYSYFDSSYSRWKKRNDEQRRKGEERARNGLWLGLGGLILGQSDNDLINAIGDGMVIGGTFMVASGLIEMNMADNDMPHMRPGCSGGYRAETKTVVVERRECISTRYTEVNRNSSRSYYEVRCENRSYVTYERFNAWEQSNRWHYSY